MPTPIALCLERAAGSAGPRFVRCVALTGRQPGLRLGPTGEIQWQPATPVAAELWVSGDERLILYRPAEAPPVTLQRAGRALDVPASKPVVAIDQDVIALAGCTLRLHVHGPATAIAAPSPLPDAAGTRRAFGRAAAVIIGSAMAAAGCSVEVRDAPPAMVPDPPPEQGQTQTTDTIEVRDRPPEPLPTPEPTPPPIEVRDFPPDVEVRDLPPDVAP